MSDVIKNNVNILSLLQEFFRMQNSIYNHD